MQSLGFFASAFNEWIVKAEGPLNIPAHGNALGELLSKS
jgi:hypothetical protein